MMPRLPVPVEVDPVVLPGAPTTGAAAELDAALRRMCDLVAIRERMRIAEILTLPEAQANLHLASILAVTGIATLEAVRAALIMADPRTMVRDGQAFSAPPN
jgi:hypothetical protein